MQRSEILKNIATEIYRIALNEDRELRSISNQGIFDMPELAFVYSCGKSIMANKELIFGDKEVEWKREVDLGTGGPTDLVFELAKGHKIVIEFKLSNDWNSYHRDIEKLARLNDVDCTRIFCALIDTFDHKLPDDGRISKVESFSTINPQQKVTVTPLMEPKPHFSTRTQYKSNTSCVVAVWNINNSNEQMV